MPRKLKMKGWVTMDSKPPTVKSFAADIQSAPIKTAGKKVGADSSRASKPTGKSKLRAVYVRPKRGSDSQAKLVIVDAANKPKFAQG